MSYILTLFAFAFIGLSALSTTSQTIVRDLNGFRLGQYRAVSHRELNAPDEQGQNSPEIRFEAFVISEEPVLYMVFQYHKDEPELIHSIQITGADGKHDPEFRGLRLGMTPGEVEKVLGKPSKKASVGEHGTLWEFDKTNYSVEISTANKLSSIRIFDRPAGAPDQKALPKFPDYVKTLQAGTNSELSALLAPDLELFEAGESKVFERAMKTEIASDSSGIFAAVRRLAKELSSVDTSKPDQYEEVTRVGIGKDMMHVVRLYKLSGVSEITLRWNGEKWQVWEFGKRPEAPVPQDWKSIYTPGSLKEIVTQRIPELIKTPNVALTKDNGKPHASFSYKSYPTSTKVVFTGETRKTPETTISLISLWLTTIGKSKELAKRFEFEFKVVENGAEYWLPIQHPIPERLAKEVKKGEQITIYLAWMGINFVDGRPELLAIVNELESVTR